MREGGVPAGELNMAKSSTRQRLIEAAGRRFYRDGFRNVGIDQILADVGISKTAFYKHFECKEDLMLAALEGQQHEMIDIFRAVARDRGGDSAIGQLHALLDVVEHLVDSDEFFGCIFVNAAMEFPLPHEPAHVAAANSKQAMEDFVYGLAVDAGAYDPRCLARELCLIMEGTYVTRHVSGSREIVDIARRVASLVIASGCPANAVAENA